MTIMQAILIGLGLIVAFSAVYAAAMIGIGARNVKKNPPHIV